MNERLDYSEFDTDYWLSRNSRALRRCAATISPRSHSPVAIATLATLAGRAACSGGSSSGSSSAGQAATGGGSEQLPPAAVAANAADAADAGATASNRPTTKLPPPPPRAAPPPLPPPRRRRQRQISGCGGARAALDRVGAESPSTAQLAGHSGQLAACASMMGDVLRYCSLLLLPAAWRTAYRHALCCRAAQRVTVACCCCSVAWLVAHLRAACRRAQQRVAVRFAGRASATWRHVAVRAAAALASGC